MKRLSFPLLATLLVLHGTASADSAGQILITGTNCESLTARQGMAVWEASCGHPLASSTLIATKFHNVPSPNEIYTPGGACLSFREVRSEVDYLGTRAYWMNGSGSIRRSSGFLDIQVGSAADLASLIGLVPLSAVGNFVFWAENGGEFGTDSKLYREAIIGDGRELVRNFSGRGIRDIIAATETHILVHTQTNRLILVYQGFVFNPVTGELTPVWAEHELATNVTAFAFDRAVGGRFYWVEDSGPSSSYQARSAGHFDPNIFPIVPDYQTHWTSGNTTYAVVSMAAQNGRIFVHERRAGLEGPIMRWRPGEIGPAPATNAFPDPKPLYLCASNDRVFWRENFNEIRTVDVDAPAVALDMRTTSVSPIQTVQGGVLPVPMIAGKSTLVRVFGKIDVDSAGIGSAQPGALLHGRIPGGAALPGSPLRPVNPNAIVDGDFPSGADPNEGFTFRLPREWTLEPSVDFTGVINPQNVYPENFTSNNSLTRNVQFNRKAPHVVSMFGIRLVNNLTPLNQYSPWMQPIFDRCESLLPGSSLRVVWKDYVMEKWILPPFWAEPYQLGGLDQDPAIDNDAWLLVAALQFVWLFDSAQFEIASPLNARLHACSLVPPGHTNWGRGDFRNFGLAGRATNNLVVLARPNGGSNPFSSALGGVTLAHELAHNFDRAHNGATGSPAGPDTGYPYGDFFGDAGSYGWDPISDTFIRFDQAGDIMSYNSERWTSEYTYKAIYNWLGDLPPGAPLGTAPPKAGKPAETDPKAPRKGVTQNGCILLFGAIDPYTGQWHMRFPYELDESQANHAFGMMENAAQLGSHLVCAYDKNGKLLYQEPVALFENNEGPGSTILACLPIDSEIMEYDLKEAQTGNVVATLAAGPNPPTVSILKPLPFSFHPGPFAVEWQGQDPDGDTLRYLVRYSRDDGNTWTIVEADTGRKQITLDESGMLPGGGKCRIMVTVNDGVHSTSVVSDEFTVEDKDPEAYLFFDTSRTGKICTAPELTVNVGETVRVHATAYDPEDGELLGASLQWSFSGPISGGGSGKVFTMPDLPSGTYNVTLSAMDSVGQGANANGTLTVLPKYLESGIAPIVDGLGTDPSYNTDHYPVSLRYLDGTVANVRAVHSGNKLYLSVSGMPLGGFVSERVVVGIDRNNSGSGTTESDDRFFVMYSTGQLALGTGNGSGFTESDPEGFDAVLNSDGTTWQAEFCIDDTALGGWDGRPVRLLVAHIDRIAVGWNAHWPNSSNRFNPSTWNETILGPHPMDPFDGDGDQIADWWEITHFGDLTSDGTADRDGDGRTDLDEFITGHDPDDFNSHASLSIIPNTSTLQWKSVVGRHYQLERSIDLHTWVPIGPARAGDGSFFTYTDPATPTPRAFYRLATVNCN